MTTPTELTLVELPLLRYLETLGYTLIDPSEHPTLRARETDVLFTPILVDALMRLNGIDEATATRLANELARIPDNEQWLRRLRNDESAKLPGEKQHQTIRLVDYDHPANNHWAATSQLRVQGDGVRKPDVVLYLNGIPIIVIEAKKPGGNQKTFDAVSQIQSAEKQIPRLFAPNLFNIATNDVTFRFGATGAPSEFWADWPDPWPRKADEFTDRTERGIYALCEPARLLNILAHFIVFETRDGKTVKKVCRYQQYRAVNKMTQRVASGDHPAGLIWHTQGSGKSLTMVFAALQLKFHRGITSPRLENPNLLIITDRIDLHDQITKTFAAAGIKNIRDVDAIDRPTDKAGNPVYPKKGAKEKFYLREEVSARATGKVVLSTIFKFQHDDPRFKSKDKKTREAALADLAVDGSENWILLVDECHRTQEKDLGAFVRAMLPHARRFGFTGTPVKKNDLDTFENFGAPGERYLDKYGIDDAVADGATVPVFYQGRMTEWHLHEKELDVTFDQWFAHESEDRIEEIKKRGVTRGDLARFEPRIALIALDIWRHFQAHLEPDGFKAQIVAIDRLACVAYKEALDTVITTSLQADGLDEAEAREQATAMSTCVYSPGQHDQKKHPELIEQFSQGLINAEEALNGAKDVAEGIKKEDSAHHDSGLRKNAYSIAAILKSFQTVEPDAPSEAAEPSSGTKSDGKLSPVQQAAVEIDELYASDEAAPNLWQDRSQLKKELRGKVRRIVQPLDLEGWQKEIPQAVEHYAVIHFSKP